MQRLIPVDDQPGWEAALAGIPHTFAHRREYCQAMTLTSGWTTFLFVSEVDGTRVVCPIAERGVQGTIDIVSPYGNAGFAGAGSSSAQSDAWRSFMEQRNYVCAYIALNTTLECPVRFPSAEISARNEMFVIDLRKPIPQEWTDVDAARRVAPGRWLLPDLRLVSDQAALSRAFVALYQPFVRRIRAEAQYRFSAETLKHLLACDGVRLVGVEEDGAIVGVHCYLHTPYGADAFLAAFAPGGECYSRLLLASAMRIFQDAGISSLNLGGGIQRGDTLAAFKSSFGAKARPLFALKQIFDRETFDRLCQANGFSPASEGYFPPYYRPKSAPASS